MFTSKTYVVTWDEMLYNAIDVDKQLSEAGLDYLVFDVCTRPQERPNWVAAEKVRYYGHFYNALVDFATTDHEVFIFNAGDAISDKHPEFVERVIKMMEQDDDVWMMAPRMKHDGGDGMTTLIQMSKKYEGMGLICHINGIYVAMRRNLAIILLKYFEWLLENKFMDFATMVTGHCLDTVYATWTIYNNKKIYRDWDFWMETVISTSYSTKNAARDCHNIKDKFMDYAGRLGGDGVKIGHIYNCIRENETTRARDTYPLLKMYPNLTSEEELDY